MANSMVMWSYVSAPDDYTLHGITASGRMWETIGMLGFFIVVGAVGIGTQMDSVNLSRVSQSVATVVGGLSLFLAYRRYEPVKAVKSVESGRNLYIAGFSELWQTAKTLSKTDPGAARYLLTSIWSEAGVASITNMAITYLSEQIQLHDFFILVRIARRQYHDFFKKRTNVYFAYMFEIYYYWLFIDGLISC